MWDDDFEWRNTIGFEERYQTSFYGDIKSVPRVRIRKNGRPIIIKGKTLATSTNKDGYLVVELHDMDGGNHPKLVHKLVWESFYGKVPEGLEVEHWDDDQTNNVLTNLYLCTHSANCNKPHYKTKKHYAMLGNTLSKGLVAPNRKPIVRLDLEYNLEKTYEYLSQVIEDGFFPGNVCQACKGTYEKSGHKYRGHLWYYTEDYKKILGEQTS